MYALSAPALEAVKTVARQRTGDDLIKWAGTPEELAIVIDNIESTAK